MFVGPVELAAQCRWCFPPFGASNMQTTAPMKTKVAVKTLIRIPAMCVATSSRISSTQNRPAPERHVQREQSPVPEPELAIDPNQYRETSKFQSSS